MAKRRKTNKIVKNMQISGPLGRVVDSYISCGRAVVLEKDLTSSASYLLYNCAKQGGNEVFDITCSSCTQSRGRDLKQLPADELRVIFEEISGKAPTGPWEAIKHNVVDVINYEILILAYTEYERYRNKLLRERQEDVVGRCHMTKREITDYNEGKEVKRVMAKKRSDDKGAKKKATNKSGGATKKASSGKGDKISKILADLTPKQMLTEAKKYGVDNAKVKKVREAVDSGTSAGLIRMRIGNLMRGVDSAKAK